MALFSFKSTRLNTYINGGLSSQDLHPANPIHFQAKLIKLPVFLGGKSHKYIFSLDDYFGALPDQTI